MRYRATIRRKQLTLVPGEFATVHGGPMACMLRAAMPKGVALADISFDDELDADERETEVDFLANDTPAARAAINCWASQAGHRRLWFRDELVEVEPSDATHRDFVTRCGSCGLEIRDSWSSLMKFVQEEGHFPFSCFACGSFVPQWQPVSEPGVEVEVERSTRPSRRAELHVVEG